MREKWILQTKRADFQALAEKFGIDPVTVRLMVNRGYDTEEKIDRYLHAGLGEMYSPHLFKDMDKGAALIASAIREGQGIIIASDYDADGICSGQILKEGFRSLGARAWVKTPDRLTEGYGLNDRIVREAVAEGASMLVTCDNGIAAFAPVTLAKSLGLTVVVTDHHEVPYTLNEDGSREYRLPEADAVIDPAQPDCGYPYAGICGATVAWKLIQVLYELFGREQDGLLPLLELAAFATITDVCELRDENRIVVREGFSVLRHTQRPAFRALASVCSVNLEQLSSYHVGFVLGPCINAAGRLADAEAAFHLLDAASLDEAWPEAARLKELNDSRKYMTQTGVEKAIEELDELERRGGLPPVLVLLLSGCHESLVGIIAGRIRERTNRPTIVLTEASGHPGTGAADRTIMPADNAAKTTDAVEKPADNVTKTTDIVEKPADNAAKTTDVVTESADNVTKSSGKSPASQALMYKGSGRSIEAYNMFDALQRCSDLLDHFGGHPMAAGLTLPAANLEAFRERLNAQCGLTEEDFVPVVTIDIAMPLGYIREDLIEEFSLLEPTGKGNPEPLFAEKSFRLRSVRPIGRERSFYRMSVMNKDGTVMDALYFGDGEAFAADVRNRFGDDAWEAALRGQPNPIELMLAYYPSVNEYRGFRSLQITVTHYSL